MHGGSSSRSGWHGLGGASSKEASREELLQQVKADRAARSEARQRSKAAAALQAGWRSFAARARLRGQLQQQWHAAYAAAAAQQGVLLPARDLREGAVRLLLAVLLPPGSGRSARLIEAGGPPGSLLSPGAGGGGSGQAASMLKGTLALVLRSVACSDASLNYAADGCCCGGGSGGGAEPVQAWRAQALRLCQLCCLVLSADLAAPDPLLDAAASRLLARLTLEPGSWGNAELQGAGGADAGAGREKPSAAQDSAAALLDGLRAQPLPLLHAVRRLVAASGAAVQQQQQQKQGGAEAPGVLNAAAVSAAGLQRVLGLAAAMLEAPSAGPSEQPPRAFADQFVLVVLTAPGLAAAVPPALRARLLQPGVVQEQLLAAAERMAASGQLSGLEALHCLANLAQLLTGWAALPAKGQQQPPAQAPGGAAALEAPALALAYCRAATRLLSAGAKQPAGARARRKAAAGKDGKQGQDGGGDGSSGGEQPPADEVLHRGCWMLGTQQHLLQLLRVLRSHSEDDGVVAWAAYCVHLLRDGGAIAAAAGPGGRDSGKRSGEDSGGSGGGGGGGSRATEGGVAGQALNVLAFSPELLPALWRWLAVTAGLPLEAPLQASRGLDIAAVAGGPQGLAEPVALVMGLWCRSLAQLLLVLDDEDLHKRQTPFSLGQSRAIASTLNSLVFHTSFPEPPAAQQQQQQLQRRQLPGGGLQARLLPATAAHGMALLSAYAPVALRGLYERDSRQQFCQPVLWTQPYHNLMAGLEAGQRQGGGGGGATAMTAAVVQALLVGFGLAEGEGDAPGGQAAAAAAGGSSVPGLRTGALLSLLRAAPQCVPFPVRLELFRQMLQQDKARGRWALAPYEGGPRPVKLTVRRSALLEDAFRGLAGAGSGIKARLSVTMVNAQGLEEAGIDHGGLAKELLEQAVAAAAQPEYGLFAATEGSCLLYPNPAAEAIPQGLALLHFVGLLVGKMLYEGILLDLAFAPFFLRSLQGSRPGLDDLAGLDPSLHASLLAVKACPPGDVEHLGLTFEAEQQLFGKAVQSELLPGGGSLPVTGDNRLLYVHLLADWHLNARVGRAAAAFAAGLSTVLPPSALRLFSPGELNQLISGGQDGGGLDVEDMARHARYGNGYTAGCSTVRMFWRVVGEMTPEQRAALLRFVTSNSRAPLGGFKHLQPPLTIHKVDCGASPLALLGGKDVDRLPSASTCFNTLRLPNYKRRATMREKLLYAIGAGAGFELS